MGNTVTLHSACAYGELGSVRRLLRTATPEQLEAKDDSGRTPLLVAIAAMKLGDGLDEDDEFSDLGEFGSEADAERSGAELSESVGRAPELVETGAAAGAEDPGEDAGADAGGAQGKESSAHSDGSEPEEVEEFTEDSVVEPLSKQAEILHLLLKKNADVHHRDENGWTALHHACFVQNAVAVRMLVHAGAKPSRDSYGLLPQDLLQRGHVSEWIAQTQELKDLLDELTPKSPYRIKLLAFRPSGIVQLDMGGQVEKGALVTIEYDVPEKHSARDYIQVLTSDEDSIEIETGSYHYVPAGKHGQITISTKDIPSSSVIRFVYVKTDINSMSRQVVASGCNAIVQASVGEIFQYELFLYERVVEVESIPEFEFIDQPLIVLKRIGIVLEDEQIDWVTVRPDNHIVAVNDIRIDAMEFTDAVRVLQENNGRQCTKLLMQNYSACGDFIPEKILGVGVVGKYAFLHPLDDDVVEQQLDDFVNNSSESEYESAEEQLPPLPTGPMSTTPLAVQEDGRELAPPAPVSYTPDPRNGSKKVDTAAESGGEDPATAVSEEKISASSTIEAVVPLHTSLQLVTQLQQVISMSQAHG